MHVLAVSLATLLIRDGIDDDKTYVFPTETVRRELDALPKEQKLAIELAFLSRTHYYYEVMGIHNRDDNWPEVLPHEKTFRTHLRCGFYTLAFACKFGREQASNIARDWINRSVANTTEHESSWVHSSCIRQGLKYYWTEYLFDELDKTPNSEEVSRLAHTMDCTRCAVRLATQQWEHMISVIQHVYQQEDRSHN